MPRYHDTPRYSHSLGITSLILGIVSLPFICMPCIGWIGVLIGSVGFVLGLFALFQSLGRDGHGIGFAIGGLTTSLFSALVSLLLLTVFAGMFALPFAAKKAVEEAKRVEEEKEKQAADAAQASIGDSVTVGNARVTLVSARLGRVRQKLGGRNWVEAGEDSLIIRLRVDNVSETKILKYLTWRDALGIGRPNATLTDEHGNEYTLGAGGGLVDDIEGGTSVADVHPGDSVTDVVAFKPPVRAATQFHLKLSAVRIGQAGGDFRFKFTREQAIPDKGPGPIEKKELPIEKKELPIEKKEPPVETKERPKEAKPPEPNPKKESPVDPDAGAKKDYAFLAGERSRVEAAAVAKFGRKPNDDDLAGFTIPYRSFVEAEMKKVFAAFENRTGKGRDTAERIIKEGDAKGWPKK